MNSLNRWSNEKFGSVSRELTKIRKMLEALSDQNRAANQLEVSALMKPMDEILYREEMMWLQRSRIPWLKEETAIQNSFIGRQLAGRRRIKSNFQKKKRMVRRPGTNLKWRIWASNFFRELYSAGAIVNAEELLNLFEPRISEETNAGLCKEYTDDEISTALVQIALI
jgi:hypothetical protein